MTFSLSSPGSPSMGSEKFQEAFFLFDDEWVFLCKGERVGSSVPNAPRGHSRRRNPRRGELQDEVHVSGEEEGGVDVINHLTPTSPPLHPLARFFALLHHLNSFFSSTTNIPQLPLFLLLFHSFPLILSCFRLFSSILPSTLSISRVRYESYIPFLPHR